MNHDILALQQELEDAQRMTGTCKISERNAMQLILKLRDLGKIDVRPNIRTHTVCLSMV